MPKGYFKDRRRVFVTNNALDPAAVVTVTGSTATTSVTPGTAATNLGKAEDAAHSSGDVGVMALAVRYDAYSGQANLAGTNLDYSPLVTDAEGLLKTANQAKGSLGRPNLYVDVASAGLYEVPCSVLIDPTTGSTASVTGGALNVVNSGAASNTTFDTKAKLAGTALTGTYQTLKTVAGTSVRTIFLMNTCNQTILVSMDGGSNDTFELEPFESVTLTPGESFQNKYYAGTIQVKHGGVAPTAGTIRYSGMNS